MLRQTCLSGQHAKIGTLNFPSASIDAVNPLPVNAITAFTGIFLVMSAIDMPIAIA